MPAAAWTLQCTLTLSHSVSVHSARRRRSARSERWNEDSDRKMPALRCSEAISCGGRHLYLPSRADSVRDRATMVTSLHRCRREARALRRARGTEKCSSVAPWTRTLSRAR